MLRVRQAVVSLLQLQDSGFQQFSLVVEKGLMQVNLHGTWLPYRKHFYLHGQQGLFPNVSHCVCAHDNSVMGNAVIPVRLVRLETGPEYSPALVQTSVITRVRN